MAAGNATSTYVRVGEGFLPLWRGDGLELYYDWGGYVTAVSIRQTGGKIELGSPRRLFPLRRGADMGNSFAASADGARFLILDGAPAMDAAITVRVP